MLATIKFKNGTEIEAELNGNNLILDQKQNFPSDLSEVTVTSDEGEWVFRNAHIQETAHLDERYWFIFVEETEQERMEREFTESDTSLQSQIDYIAMMTDVDMEVE